MGRRRQGLISQGTTWSPQEACVLEQNVCLLHQSLVVLWGWTGISQPPCFLMNLGGWLASGAFVIFEPTMSKYPA